MPVDHHRAAIVMKSILRSPLGFLAIIAAISASGPARAAAGLPIAGRTLNCILGHALNLDPRKDQRLDEVRYEGRFPFALYLPASKIRDKPSPTADVPGKPVNPATRIIADPAGLRRGVPSGFARVVDLWPERVEMTQVISGPLVHFIVINQIDEAGGTANLFMTTATDIAAMNLKTVYQGRCIIAKDHAARSVARR